MAYIGLAPGVSSQRMEDTFTATAGQTSFVPSSGYVPGNIDVYRNGVKLANGLEFTASDGITVVLNNACAAGDSVVLLSYIPRGLSDGYTKPEADSRYFAQSSSMGFRNRIINGDMRIDQRNNGAAVTANSTSAVYGADRFIVNTGGMSASATVQQVTDAPAGFNNSLKITVTSTATPTAGQFTFSRQIIEGLNIADLAWGTSSASPVTVSFWVKASITGTYALFLINSAEDRSYVATFTVSSANTWEQKVITVPGDTTGTWLTNNSNGIRIGFDLGSGTNYHGTGNTWQAGWKQRTSATVGLFQNNGATFQYTGVQLEKGTVATPFEFRSYGQELQLCQRYYEETIVLFSTSAYSAALMQAFWKVPKRAIPTLVSVPDVGGGGTYSANNSNHFLYQTTGNSAVTGGVVKGNSEL